MLVMGVLVLGLFVASRGTMLLPPLNPSLRALFSITGDASTICFPFCEYCMHKPVKLLGLVGTQAGDSWPEEAPEPNQNPTLVLYG